MEDEALDEEVFTQDLDEIRDKYPDEAADDVTALGEEFAQLRASGVDAVKAYELVNLDKIVEQRSKAAVVEDRKKRESKKHLAGGGVTGAGVGGDIPASVYEQYRKFFPDLTDKEIRKHYNAASQD